jgi:CheY-like chemotaxis protein
MRQPVVLVADDESSIRTIARQYLEGDGYDVLEAADGHAAVAVVEGSAAIDLLIADLVMPGMPGEELARRARLARPDLKILYVSGMIDRLLDKRQVLWEGEAFLEKPFSEASLREAVTLLLFGTTRNRGSEQNLPLTCPSCRSMDIAIVARRFRSLGCRCADCSTEFTVAPPHRLRRFGPRPKHES